MKRIVLARIGAAHGVRGEVRLKLYGSDPAALTAHGPLTTEDGREIAVLSTRPAGGASDMLVAKLKGVTDRTAAEGLNGLELGLPRDRLPLPGEDDFYHADLIGLAVETLGGVRIGMVVAVPNYGAGDLLEIAPARGPTVLVPFTRAVVPVVDLVQGRVVIDPPAGLFDTDDSSES